MLRPREKIKSCCGDQGISLRLKAQNIAGQGRRLAGDIDHALRPHGGNGLDRVLSHALARRVDYHDFGTEPAFCELLRGLSRVRADKVGIVYPVQHGVGLRVLYGLRHDLGRDDAPGLAGKAEADRTRAAVEIKGQVFLCERRVFQRLLIKPLRLRGIDLEGGQCQRRGRRACRASPPCPRACKTHRRAPCFPPSC